MDILLARDSRRPGHENVSVPEILVNSEPLIECPYCAFKSQGDLFALRVIETLGIDARHTEHNAQGAVLSKEGMLIDEPEQANERAHRARFEKVLGDLTNADHGRLPTIWRVAKSRFAGS